MSKDGTRIVSLARVVALQDRIAELEAALQAGRDLMAIVHGDGGHYCESHGDRKAADDAIAIVSKLRSYMDDERARRASSAPEDTGAMSDNGQQVPPIERLRVSDPHDSNLRRAADLCRDLGRSALAEAVSRAIDRIAELEAELAAERERREDIRANERRVLREKLICAALTGMLTVSKDKDALTDIARAAILQADAVLDALDKEAAR